MTTLPLEKERVRYGWEDYRGWPADERWELIAGVAFAMAPAPSPGHQDLVLNLASWFRRALAGRPCKPFIAPTDVKLSEFDVVQPDIFLVCDAARITATHIDGVPELVVEVLSPHTSTRDLREKKALYERVGVGEYLVVDPLERYVIRFLNGAGGFDKGTVFGADERLIVATLEGMELPLGEVFEGVRSDT